MHTDKHRFVKILASLKTKKILAFNPCVSVKSVSLKKIGANHEI